MQLRPTLPARAAGRCPSSTRPRTTPSGSHFRPAPVVARVVPKGNAPETSDDESTRPADASENYLEAALRSLMLGVGVGAAVEVAHVSMEASALLPGLLEEPTLLLSGSMLEELAPLVGLDNLAAITTACVLYGLEAAAVVAILRRYPDDRHKAARVLKAMPTLSKRMLPLSVDRLKRLIFKLSASGGSPTAAAAAFGFLPSDSVRPSGSSSSGARASSGSSRDSVGTAVLDRPPAVPQGEDSDDAPSTSPEAAQQRTLPPLERPPGRLPGSPLTPPLPNLFPGDGDNDLLQQPGQSEPAAPPKQRARIISTSTVASPPKPATGVRPEKRAGLKPGQMDPRAAPPLSKREQELRERRCYLKNFWYAAALSQNLGDKPLEVKMLGRTVVLFRDEDGVPHALDNICPHRGAPLSNGWLKEIDDPNPPVKTHSCKSNEGGGKGPAAKKSNTCVVCPYHGWAFDTEGKLREVPSTDDQSRLPKRPLVDAYPVVEKGGFVWLFFGSKNLPAEERPPIPFTPELEDPNWQAVYGEMEFNSPHFSVFDNAIDMAHIHFLHSGSFGNKDKPTVRNMAVTKDTFEVSATFDIHNKPVSALWEWTATESVPVVAKAMLPSNSMIKIQLGAGVSMITFVCTVPIDEHRSINRFCLIRNFAGWAGFDDYTRASMLKILTEDKVMLETLNPDAIHREVSLEADLPQVAFRRLRSEWAALPGYLAEPEAVKGHAGTLSDQ